MEIDMKSLLCPISPLRTSEATVRLTGVLVAALIGLYTLTGAMLVPLALASDYALRAFTRHDLTTARHRSWL
jgi:hypothetical protein